MSWFKRGSGDDPNPIEWLLGIIAYIIVEPARYFWRRVYNHGFGGAFMAIISGISGLYFGVFQFGAYLRYGLHYPWYLWLPLALLAWTIYFFYVFPPLWLWVVKPFVDLGEWIHDKARDLSKPYAEPFFSGLLKALSALTIVGYFM